MSGESQNRDDTAPILVVNPAETASQLAASGESEHWTLRLYIAGESPKSRTALTNLRRLCELHVPGRYEIEVIDLAKNPALAKKHQILAIPTLVRHLPEPMKRVIGDLSDGDKASMLLEFAAKSP